jgi:CBS domain-containing protein
MTGCIEVQVREVMSGHVVTISTTNTLSDVLDRFRVTGLRHLVITDDETGACAGVVSDRTVSAIWPGLAMSGLERRVAEVLNPDRSTVRAEDTVNAAARRMLDAGGDTLPVIDASAEVVGIVTGSDLLGVLASSDQGTAVGDRR